VWDQGPYAGYRRYIDADGVNEMLDGCMTAIAQEPALDLLLYIIRWSGAQKIKTL